MTRGGRITEHVSLAQRTTLELGGPARFYCVARRDGELVDALSWAEQQQVPVVVLAGGSNVVVADAGFDGLVIDLQTRGVSQERRGDDVTLTVQAGESWDALVAHCVMMGYAGLECLSGIPGRVGATPIQNVGAYGQEVADTITEVHVLEPSTGLTHYLSHEDCAFAYRHSRFKREPARFIVLSVTFALHHGPPSPPRYAELQRALTDTPNPTLAQVRARVIELRRAKSMVIDSSDPNRRSVGSFFTNPIVTEAQAQQVVERALAAGLIQRADELPTYSVLSTTLPSTSEGHRKLAAGWLIERAGFTKGLRQGAVGISSRHSLSLVHHGGGTTEQLLSLARRVRDGVHDAFGVTLTPEPAFVGFDRAPV